jgi:hypothetical protein
VQRPTVSVAGWNAKQSQLNAPGMACLCVSVRGAPSIACAVTPRNAARLHNRGTPRLQHIVVDDVYGDPPVRGFVALEGPATDGLQLEGQRVGLGACVHAVAMQVEGESLLVGRHMHHSANSVGRVRSSLLDE